MSTHPLIYFVIANAFVHFSQMNTALGLQWRMAAIIVLLLWFCALPTVLWFASYQGGGLVTEWRILPVYYLVMQALLVAAYVRVDWSATASRKSLRLSTTSSTLMTEPTVDDEGDDYDNNVQPNERTTLLPLVKHISASVPV